jgi:hypothetical protein
MKDEKPIGSVDDNASLPDWPTPSNTGDHLRQLGHEINRPKFSAPVLTELSPEEGASRSLIAATLAFHDCEAQFVRVPAEYMELIEAVAEYRKTFPAGHTNHDDVQDAATGER